ncbi:MAG: hypothetical protein INR64_04595 [Caulobacteraceae bacterium]|nr:hypothetical protein [Caulobacter sp.]
MIADQLTGLAAAFHSAGRPEGEAERLLDRSQRLLFRWRSHRLAERYMARHGERVFAGPFAGMAFTADQSEGALCPKLLGTYEAELHPALRRLAAQGVSRVIDVGCAEGYYAVGLARLMPQARVEAFDVDPKGRARCAELAARNGVAERVAVGARWSLAAAGDVGPGTLVFMDVEGAEAELLGPEAPAALARAELIVETHPWMARGVTEALAARFAPTHAVEVVWEAPKRAPSGAFGGRLLSLDEFAATWEWRATPTPWLVMRPRT